MLNARHSLGVQRFKMHRMHKPANLLFTEVIFLRLQFQRYLSVAVEGQLAVYRKDKGLMALLIRKRSFLRVGQ